MNLKQSWIKTLVFASTMAISATTHAQPSTSPAPIPNPQEKDTFNLPSDYETWESTQKSSFIWGQIRSTAYDPMPKLPEPASIWQLLMSLVETLLRGNTVFDKSSDFKATPFLNSIHTWGAAALFHIKPSDTPHPFTGLYKERSIGVVRLSSLNSPGLNQESDFMPGLGLKFLVNGQPSKNLLTVPTSLLEKPWNMFDPTQSNVIDLTNQPQVIKSLFGVLKSFEDPSTRVSPQPLAGIYTNGYQEESPVAPEEVLFKPTQVAKEAGLIAMGEDFRVNLHTKIPSSTELYEMYGRLDGDEYFIGTLVLDTAFLASKFGDERLFFRHNRNT